MMTDDRHGVFLFPGIGVRPFGKEADFFRAYRAIIAPFFDLGSELAGADLAAGLQQEASFADNPFHQEVFAYAFAHGAFQVFRELGYSPRLTAGHSLGVYAALTAAGALSFTDGLMVIDRAHRLGRAGNAGEHFGVVVIIGLDHGDVAAMLAREGLHSVNLANLNSAASGVYVGRRDETNRLRAWADGAGAVKTIPLPVDIPFHSPLFMGGASRELRHFLATLSWQPPCCPVLSAMDHRLLTTTADLIEMTAANLSQAIHWPGVIRKLAAMGVTAVIECGAGVSLSQHARFIDGAPKHSNLRNMRRRLHY